MTECLFHTDQHAVAEIELLAQDGELLKVPVCELCAERVYQYEEKQRL